MEAGHACKKAHGKARKPRGWRTRKDPFSSHWPEVERIYRCPELKKLVLRAKGFSSATVSPELVSSCSMSFSLSLSQDGMIFEGWPCRRGFGRVATAWSRGDVRLCAITSRKPHFPGERKRPRLLRRVWMERTRGLSSGGPGFARFPSSRGGHGGELPEVVGEDAPHDPCAAVLETLAAKRSAHVVVGQDRDPRLG